MVDTKHNTVDRRNAAAYTRDFLPGIVGYGIAVAVSTAVLNSSTGGWLRYLAMLLPVVPALWVARAVARALARADEYQRLLQLTALAVGFGVATITAMTVGFLSIGGVSTERWGPWLIFSAGMLGWLVAATKVRSTEA